MRRLALTLATLAAVATSPALAEVTVRGDAVDMVVEATEADLADVIVAVGEAVGSTIDPPPTLRAATITGVYRGSVSDVLKALAPSADFVVAWRDGRVSVHFVDGDALSSPVAEAKPAEAVGDEDGQSPDDAGQDVPGEPGGEEPPTPARKVY
jgi:hypothetical protein